MAWRVEWRTTRPQTTQGVTAQIPHDVKWEEGHSGLMALARARELVDGGACWVVLEDLSLMFKGSSAERPKPLKKVVNRK